MAQNEVHQLAVNTTRALAIEAVEEAKSGHPGMPLGAAPMAFELFYNHMKHSPRNPKWLNRDRFVLSAGHGSALLYSLLHLFGYDVTIDDLRSFRQVGSITPGHPEYKLTPGVEATTGPLGQGLAVATGMAVAETHLAAKYNRPGFPIIDHYTYVICSDGDLMEGVSSEASSLAGHWNLGKLIVLYDDNNITIDGSTDLAFSEDVTMRYEAYGWQVLSVDEGDDIEAIAAALVKAKANLDQPTLIRVRTIIGKYSPVAGDSKSHGAPLGTDSVKTTLHEMGFNSEREPFDVAPEVAHYMRNKQAELAEQEKNWLRIWQDWQDKYPELASELEGSLEGILPADLFSEEFFSLKDAAATRVQSGKMLNYINKKLPNLLGGSADLAGSNNSTLDGSGEFQKNYRQGKNIHFGVREFGMASIINGIVLHGGLRGFAATFFIFTDYMKMSMRLAALMDIPVLYILTHDSIGLGEDGPTHEPIEQLATFRAMPNINVFRPADGVETAAGYQLWLESQRPTALILTRQKLSYVQGDPEGALRGAYVLKDSQDFDIILIASGSEVEIALAAHDMLAEEDIRARVVSMPCQNLFDGQDRAYRNQVLPPSCRKRVSVEAAATFGWQKYIGIEGVAVGMESFGGSGKGSDLFKHFGLTPEAVAEAAKGLLETKAR
ncbi:MAG TPA: transketolase [Clostridiaceae bacterium]|nr:transketolase [Clostridiaceae bacterium]